MADLFEELAAGMSSERKAEFYGVLHQSGIGRHDVELAKLFRVLQLYKAYYETVPDSVMQAVAEIDKLKKEVGELVEQADQSAAASEKLLNRFSLEAAEVGESLRKLHTHVEEAAGKASVVVSKRMTEMLSEAMSKHLPLDALAQAGKNFSESVVASNKASSELQANIKIIRRAHYKAYALAACSLVFSAWIYLYFRYEQKTVETRAAILAEVQSNQAASVISILQERLTFFRYLCDSDGTFSFRDFIRDGKHRGNLFLMNIRRCDAIFRPLMTFVIDIMIREVLSLSDSFTRRVTFVVDEFGSLSKLPSIFDFLTMGRSKGGFLVLANQDLGSVSNVYGHDQKETFFNNFNIHLIFRLNDPTTAEFLSKATGEREVVKKFRSSQFSPNDLGDRFSLGEQEKLEKVILPTEFQNLPDFHTYLKIANHGIAKMETRRKFMKSVAEEFVQRDFKLDDMLHES